MFIGSHNLAQVLIDVIVLGVVAWFVFYLLAQLPEPAQTPAKVVAVLIILIILLRFVGLF